MGAFDRNEAVNVIVAEAHVHRGDEPGAEFRRALDTLKTCPADERDAVRTELASRLSSIESPAGAGFIAVWLGGLLEAGDDPDPLLPHLTQAMLALARRVKRESDLDANLDTGLSLLGRSLTAHLARCSDDAFYEARQGELPAELERIREVNNGVLWLTTLLRQHSGELVVLHGVEAAGFRVRYENLSNCFQLFTLLQDALADDMPGSLTPNPNAAAVARGDEEGDALDEAWWHYGQAISPEADPTAVVAGESTLDSIVKVDGKQVMLLWPPIMGVRSWGAGFFRPIVKERAPHVAVRRKLSDDDIASWRRRLRLPVAKTKPWWKVW